MIGRIFRVLPSIVIVAFNCGVAFDQTPCGNLSITSITIFPNYKSYTVGSTVTISCNATIGSSDTGQEWIWKYHDGTGWHPYTKEIDIRKDAPSLVGGSCSYYLQTCHLTRVISMEDNGTFYTCTVMRDNVTATIESIGIENVEDKTSSATTSLTITTTGAGKQISSAGGFTNNLLIYFITSVPLAFMMSGGF